METTSSSSSTSSSQEPTETSKSSTTTQPQSFLTQALHGNPILVSVTPPSPSIAPQFSSESDVAGESKKKGMLRNLHDFKPLKTDASTTSTATPPKPVYSTSPPSTTSTTNPTTSSRSLAPVIPISTPSTGAIPAPSTSSAALLQDSKFLSTSPSEAGSSSDTEVGERIKRSSRTKENIVKAKNFAKRMLHASATTAVHRERTSSLKTKPLSGSFNPALELPPEEEKEVAASSTTSDEAEAPNSTQDGVKSQEPQLLQTENEESGADLVDGSNVLVHSISHSVDPTRKDKVKAFAKKIVSGINNSGSFIVGTNSTGLSSGKSSRNTPSLPPGVFQTSLLPSGSNLNVTTTSSSGYPPSSSSSSSALNNSNQHGVSSPSLRLPPTSSEESVANTSPPGTPLLPLSNSSTAAGIVGGLLEVTICRARNLYSADDGMVDAYCEVVLLDYFGNASKKDERKTKVVRGSLEPIWEETFVFEFDSGECSGLKITLKDNHRFREDSFLGYVTISTSGLLNTVEKVDRWFPLCARKKDKRTCITGDILVRIMCLSESEAQKRRAMKVYNVKEIPAAKQKVKQKLKKHFGASDDEILYDEFSCALRGKQGRMFVTSRYLYFYSNILVLTKLRISYEDIKSVEKKKTALLFPNAILITVKNSKFFFYSFIHRDRAYQLIRMKKCSYLRKQTDEPFLDEFDEKEEVEEEIQPDVLVEGDHDDEFLSITPKTNRSEDSITTKGEIVLASSVTPTETKTHIPTWIESVDHGVSPIVPLLPLDDLKAASLEHAASVHLPRNTIPSPTKKSSSILSQSQAPSSSTSSVVASEKDHFDFLGSLSPRATVSSSSTSAKHKQTLAKTDPVPTPAPAVPSTKETALRKSDETPLSSESTPTTTTLVEETNSTRPGGGTRPTALPLHLMGPHVLGSHISAATSTSTKTKLAENGKQQKEDSLGHRGKCVVLILVMMFLSGFILPGVSGGWQAICAFSIIFSMFVNLLQKSFYVQTQQLGLYLAETMSPGGGNAQSSDAALRMEFLALNVFPLLVQPFIYFGFTFAAWLLIDDFILQGFFGWFFFPLISSLAGSFIYHRKTLDSLSTPLSGKEKLKDNEKDKES